MAMTYLSTGDEAQGGAWLDRAANAAISVASTPMARRLEMWRGSHAASRDDLEGVIAHFERAAELAGQKNLGARCEALSTLAFEAARIGVATGDEGAMKKAKEAAVETLRTVRPMSGGLPFEADAHAALALVAQSEGDGETAAEEARASLDFDGETFITQYLHVLWVAGRVLIVGNAPEAAALREEILAGMGFVDMSIADPELKARWFGLPTHRELAEIVGFEPSQGGQPEDTVELGEDDLELLRELASGSNTDDRPRGPGGPGDVEELLAKLGVASQSEAIEYAIKAGVTWQ
jgi:hypothetical protein